MFKTQVFRVDPDNRYAEDRKVQPVKTYKLSKEELDKYVTTPYKKPIVFKPHKKREVAKLETVEKYEAKKEETKEEKAKQVKLTDKLIGEEYKKGLTAEEIADKYDKAAFWVKGRISRIERAERKEQPCPAEQKNHKHDTGKPRLDLVPPGIIEAVGIIRTYGTEKYGDPDGWKEVEANRYVSAMMRHMVEYLRDKNSVDKESGLPHMWHIACNVAFLIEFAENEKKQTQTLKNYYNETIEQT